uniref:Uncharacterized protein LOC111123779 isoform X1 n=1 Tax=Crassostrea virginica TaxID=6565 RepID=A0A8B8D1U5_CRAVI|nr:uncharacterized protein LOC111123779 isoform X1 [Crassostrea virginica]
MKFILPVVCVWILTYCHWIQCSIHLWASEVTRFSSQYNTGGLSANQILGKPNVYPRYGDIVGTWTQNGGQLDRVHFIEIKFPRKVYLKEVSIFETYHAGAVVRVAAKDPQNQWMDVYNVTHAHVIRKSRIFSPKIKGVQFPVDELRIEVDCSASNNYVEIDAVKIVGDRCPEQYKEYRNSCYFVKKDSVSGDKAFIRCLEAGGYLANLETLEEAMFFKNLVKNMKTGLSFYVGGRNINRRKPGGDWRWIKNGKMSKMTYFAFGATQPDGNDKYPQDCMFFYAPDRYKLHDVFCDNGHYLGGYICEIDQL